MNVSRRRLGCTVLVILCLGFGVSLLVSQITQQPAILFKAAVTDEIGVVSPAALGSGTRRGTWGVRMSRPASDVAPVDRPEDTLDVYAAFAVWASHAAASRGVATASELAAGRRLACRRHEAMVELIAADPEEALKRAISPQIRHALPPEIQSWVEERVSGRGDLVVRVTREGLDRSRVSRRAVILGKSYDAYVYGRRLDDLSLPGITFYGVAAGGRMAVGAEPARVMSSAEALVIAPAGADVVCGISRKKLTPTDASALDLAGEVHWTCGRVHAAELNDQMFRAERRGRLLAADGTARASASYTLGVKKLLLVRVDFPDLVGDPFTDSRTAGLFKELNDFYSGSSLGQLSFPAPGGGGAVTPTLRMGQSAAVYAAADPTVLRDEALAAALVAGYARDDFDFDVICFGAVPGWNWTGTANVGVPGAWVRDVFNHVGGLAHELGHNLGLNHANFWDTGGRTTLGEGIEVEYGDSFDTMGVASGGRRQFNARYKNLLGWIPNAAVSQVTNRGVFRLFAHDMTNETAGARALLLPKDSMLNYWFEFRQQFPAPIPTFNGIQVRWAGIGNRGTRLLDMSPGSVGGIADSPLAFGQTFYEPSLDVYLTPLGKNGTIPESVDLAVEFGQPNGNHGPTLDWVQAPTTATLNTPVTLSVATADADNDPIALHWDPGDGALLPNAATVSKSWSAPGEYVVRCTASDLHGGIAVRTRIVVVGSPVSARVLGTVRSNGQPVPGVRVFVSGKKVAYTDNEGKYALTGMTNASYTVEAYSEMPWAFVPGFTNPISTAVPGSYDFSVYTPEDLQAVPLIAPHADWRYVDTGVPPPADWNTSGFADSEWKSGPAPLGYGQTELATTVEFGPNVNGKWITTFFRRRFVVQDAAQFLLARLLLQRDDAAVVYLNGREIWRSNLGEGFVNFLTFAQTAVTSPAETEAYSLWVQPVGLVRGTNVVAVEVHQSNPSDPDLRFDFGMEGFRLPVADPAPPRLDVIVDDTGLMLFWPDTANWQLQEAGELGATPGWKPVLGEPIPGNATARIHLPSIDGPRFFRLVLGGP